MTRRKPCFDSRLRYCYAFCALAACLLLVRSASAEITVPQSNEPHKPIVISVQPSGIPENAQVRGSVSCSTADLLPGSQEGQWHCWAKPGTHSVTASGVWVVTRELQLEGQSVPVLVDFGQYREVAEFVVEGDEPQPNPNPNPQPQPNPDQKKRVVIVEESSQRTTQHANLYARLRQTDLNARIADQHDASPEVRRYVAEIPDGGYLPWLFVVGEDGSILYGAYLPPTATVEQIEEMAR
jgi:hypothetical protein